MSRFFQRGRISPQAGGLCGRHHSDELAGGCHLPAAGVCVGVHESLERDGDLKPSLSAWTLAALRFFTVGHVAGRGAAGQRAAVGGEAAKMSPGGLGDGGGVTTKRRPGPQGPLFSRLCSFLMISGGQSNWLSIVALALGGLGEPTALSFSAISVSSLPEPLSF